MLCFLKVLLHKIIFEIFFYFFFNFRLTILISYLILFRNFAFILFWDTLMLEIWFKLFSKLLGFKYCTFILLLLIGFRAKVRLFLLFCQCHRSKRKDVWFFASSSDSHNPRNHLRHPVQYTDDASSLARNDVPSLALVWAMVLSW